GAPQLRFTREGSGIRVTDGANRPLSRGAFEERWQEMLGIQQQRATALEARLADATTRLSGQRSELSSQRTDVAQRTVAHRQEAAALEATLAELRRQGPAALADIERILASPEALNSFSEAAQAELRGLAERYRSVQTEG